MENDDRSPLARFGRVEFVASTGSTNDDMAALLGSARARGLSIVAEYQHRGAGRKGRRWVAPPGSALLCTTALPDPLPTQHLWAVPFWAALALRDALAQHGVRATLQWPNDLLLAGRKLAGILCVSRVNGAQAWVGIGVGVNLCPPADDAGRRQLAGVSPPPAFCSDAAPVERETLLRSLLRAYDASLESLALPAQIVRQWESAAGLPGARYRLLVDGEREPFEAQALRVADGGALILAHNGRERAVALADARVLRD